MPVPAVGARGVVALGHGRASANRHGFLSGVDVAGALEDVAAEEFKDLVLEAADFHHLPQQADLELFRQAPRLGGRSLGRLGLGRCRLLTFDFAYLGHCDDSPKNAPRKRGG